MLNTKKLVACALLIAIIIIMSFTPLGYLKIGPLSITFLTVPVMIGAIILGPAAGAALGLTFGLTSYFQAMSGSSPLGALMFATNPFLAFVVCVIPRVLVGLFCGLIFKGMKKAFGKSFASFAVAAFSAPVLNTVLFMSTLLICFWNTLMSQDSIRAVFEKSGGNIVVFVALFVGINALVEAIFCTIAGSAVSKAVYKSING